MKNRIDFNIVFSAILIFALIVLIGAYSLLDHKYVSLKETAIDSGQVEELQVSMESKNAIIEEKEAQIELLQSQLNELSEDAESNAEIIASLTAEIAQLQSQITALQNAPMTIGGYSITDDGTRAVVQLEGVSFTDYIQETAPNTLNFGHINSLKNLVSVQSCSQLNLNHYFMFSRNYSNTLISMGEGFYDFDAQHSQLTYNYTFSVNGYNSIDEMPIDCSLLYRVSLEYDFFTAQELSQLGLTTYNNGVIKTLTINLEVVCLAP